MHVDEDLYKNLEDIMNERTEEIRNNYPPNSFDRLFWEQQLEAMKVKDVTQVRWRLMIKWCLSLKLLSPCAYHTLCSSNLLVLPSERTLRDYTHFIKAKAGFQAEVVSYAEKQGLIAFQTARSLSASCLMRSKSRKT